MASSMVHPMNARGPMNCSPGGSTIVLSDVQPANAKELMVFRVSGSSTDTSLVQRQNARSSRWRRTTPSSICDGTVACPLSTRCPSRSAAVLACV